MTEDQQRIKDLEEENRRLIAKSKAMEDLLKGFDADERPIEVGKPLPLSIQAFGFMMVSLLQCYPEAKNYIAWAFIDHATGEEYEVSIGRVRGQPLMAMNEALKAEVAKLKEEIEHLRLNHIDPFPR